MKTQFEWDEVKAANNKRKHGVSFTTAALVFLDPDAIFTQDSSVASEVRWQVLGIADRNTVLLVIHAVLEQDNTEVIRIISARLAERWERSLYEQQNS